jgi:sterol 3beta-glucosyltransferase
MALNRTKSHGLGNLTFGDGSPDAKDVTSGNVQLDGRVKIQCHQDARSVVSWFKQFQPKTPTEEPCKKRKFSTVALPEGPKPPTGPRLNIAIHIVGSRGDVQPFIPIAQQLSRPPLNHRVRICTHPVFKDFVEEQGVEFFSIGGDPGALMLYMVKNPGLIPSRESVKAGDIGKRRKEMWEIINGAWRSCVEAGNGMGERIRAADVPEARDLFLADAIIANPPSMAHIHCAEKLGIPLHMVFTMPWSPTGAFPHPLAAMKYGNTDAAVANYFSFAVMELLTWQGFVSPVFIVVHY